MKVTHTILIAEDDEDDLQFITDAFIRNHFPGKVSCVNDGEKLMRVLNANSGTPLPDAILLDLNMPFKDGYQTLKEIKEDAAFKDIPTLILTSSSSREEEARCLSMGASGFFRKPVSLDDYDHVAARILGTIGMG